MKLFTLLNNYMIMVRLLKYEKFKKLEDLFVVTDINKYFLTCYINNSKLANVRKKVFVSNYWLLFDSSDRKKTFPIQISICHLWNCTKKNYLSIIFFCFFYFQLCLTRFKIIGKHDILWRFLIPSYLCLLCFLLRTEETVLQWA